MGTVIREDEIDGIVRKVYADLDGKKNIDAVSIYNKPDKAEVRELVNNLFRVIYPGITETDPLRYSIRRTPSQ